jgi:hypothetical protein
MKKQIVAICVVSLCGLGAVLAGEKNTKTEWAQTRFGRLSSHPGNWSMDSETVQKFQPSGVGTQICRSGDYTILYNHGLYWSNEENPDTSQDMHASVIIFKGAKRVFVGRGYKYLEFQANPWENTFSFQHWTGTMGHNQITHYAFTVTDDALQLATRKSNA